VRQYRGVDTRIRDPRTRLALTEIDAFLRDLIRAQPNVGSMTTRDVVDDAQFVVLKLNDGLSSERKLTVSSPIALADGGANGNVVLSVGNAAPALVLGTTNAAGSAAAAPLRVDASLALFDGTTPAAIAATAATGVANFAARSDHAHIFPTSLRATADASALTLTASGTTNTLTGTLATLVLTGMTRVELGATTATVDLGRTLRRLKSVWSVDGNFSGTLTGSGTSAVLDFSAGTGTHSIGGTLNLTNIDISGALTILSVGSDLTPSSPTYKLGDSAVNGWASLSLQDSSAAFQVKFQCTSSTALTASRQLTIDMVNAARTVKFTGNPTLADWFDQNVKTTGSPQFSKLGVAAAPGLNIFRVDNSVGAPGTTVSVFGIINVYGTDNGKILADPAAWLGVNMGGTNYKIPLY